MCAEISIMKVIVEPINHLIDMLIIMNDIHIVARILSFVVAILNIILKIQI